MDKLLKVTEGSPVYFEALYDALINLHLDKKISDTFLFSKPSKHLTLGATTSVKYIKINKAKELGFPVTRSVFRAKRTSAICWDGHTYQQVIIFNPKERPDLTGEFVLNKLVEFFNQIGIDAKIASNDIEVGGKKIAAICDCVYLGNCMSEVLNTRSIWFFIANHRQPSDEMEQFYNLPSEKHGGIIKGRITSIEDVLGKPIDDDIIINKLKELFELNGEFEELTDDIRGEVNGLMDKHYSKEWLLYG